MITDAVIKHLPPSTTTIKCNFHGTQKQLCSMKTKPVTNLTQTLNESGDDQCKKKHGDNLCNHPTASFMAPGDMEPKQETKAPCKYFALHH